MIPVRPDLRDFDWCERNMPCEDFLGLTLFACLRERNRTRARAAERERLRRQFERPHT